MGKVVALFVLTIFILRYVGGFIFTPYSTPNSIGFNYFRAHSDVDTIVVGSSVGMYALDPYVLDEELGSNVANLATQGQNLKDTKKIVSWALEKNPRIKRVIIAFNTASFTDDYGISPRIQAVTQYNSHRSLVQRLQSYIDLALDPSFRKQPVSLNIAFPWVYNFTTNIPSVFANIKAKLFHEDYIEAAQSIDPVWRYVGKGFGIRLGHLSQPLGLNQPNPNTNQPKEYFVRAYADLLAYCKSRGLIVDVVSMPNSASNISASSAVYPTLFSRLQSIAQAAGVTYFDTNMLTKGLLTLTHEDFYDNEHLNDNGMRAFTPVFAKLLKQAEDQAIPEGTFLPYSQFDQWADRCELFATT